MIGIVDYNAGNIKSVERALQAINVPYILSQNYKELEKCSHLIFPGDGEARYAMEQLKILSLDSFLRSWKDAQKPLLGICIGSQIIFDYSEEGDTECLGLLKGCVKHFSSLWSESQLDEKIKLKVPHMGWNNLIFCNGTSPLLENVKENSDVYFVHSYVIQAEDESIIKAYVDYGIKVPAFVSSGSISAFQFHPEKSGEQGLQLLKNFCASGDCLQC